MFFPRQFFWIIFFEIKKLNVVKIATVQFVGRGLVGWSGVCGSFRHVFHAKKVAVPLAHRAEKFFLDSIF